MVKKLCVGSIFLLLVSSKKKLPYFLLQIVFFQQNPKIIFSVSSHIFWCLFTVIFKEENTKYIIDNVQI